MSIKNKLIDLKLPKEWIQLFRIILSIYLIWLILLTPKKPIFTNNLSSRIVFVILLFLFIQTDFLSGLLLIMIYFFSFQSVLPIVWEGFENLDDDEEDFEDKKEEDKKEEEDEDEDKKKKSTPTTIPNLEDRLEKNLKRPSNVFPEETPKPTKNFKISYGTDKALKLNQYDD
jgi:hypothetical protein